LDIASWINSHGGYVDPRLKGSVTSHNGIKIRGVVSTKAVEQPGQLVFRIPKKLWFTLDKFPDINSAELAQLPNCSAPLREPHFNLVKMAGALAREKKKQNASLFDVYISKLPTLADFRSFHPRFMKDDVRDDFSGLPVSDVARELQLFDLKLTNCFLSWTKVASSPVAGITAEEFDEAQSQYRTRAFSTSEKHGITTALIPGADLLNTDRPLTFNIDWRVKNDNFFLVDSDQGVGSGVELIDSYCEGCNNEHMMEIWGLYLELNENPLQTVADCNTHHEHTRGKFKSLREASEAMLDMSGVDKAIKEGWKAPRCREELLSVEQGPLRCSFARLAFEHCKQEWGYLGSRVPEYALAQHSSNVAEMADMISLSYIHAVHPALMSTGRGFHKNLRRNQQSQHTLL
jgi:hypothetical protein